MQDTLKELKEQMQDISFVAHEASEERQTREKKNIIICFTIIVITLIIALIGTNLAWLIYENSMETVTETFTTETVETITYEDVSQSTDGGGNNVIGGDVNG
jgi:hypothetical protein